MSLDELLGGGGKYISLASSKTLVDVHISTDSTSFYKHMGAKVVGSLYGHHVYEFVPKSRAWYIHPQGEEASRFIEELISMQQNGRSP